MTPAIPQDVSTTRTNILAAIFGLWIAIAPFTIAAGAAFALVALLSGGRLMCAVRPSIVPADLADRVAEGLRLHAETSPGARAQTPDSRDAEFIVWAYREIPALLTALSEMSTHLDRLGSGIEQISAHLEQHRTDSSRFFAADRGEPPRYANPVREGYDRGLTSALALLGVDAKEKTDGA